MSSRVVLMVLLLGMGSLGCSSKSLKQAAAIERLNSFRTRVGAIEAGNETVELDESDAELISEGLTDQDRMTLKALIEFGKTIHDNDLDTVIQYGLSEDGRQIRWLLAWLLVERRQYDSAAQIIVSDLVAKSENRSYRTWKWWEYSFGEREDYKKRSRDFCDALLRRFEAGDSDSKLVVAELFGTSAREAKLSLPEFKDAVHYEDKVRRSE